MTNMEDEQKEQQKQQSQPDQTSKEETSQKPEEPRKEVWTYFIPSFKDQALRYKKELEEMMLKEKEAKNLASPKNESLEEPQKKQKNQVNPLKHRKKKKRR